MWLHISFGVFFLFDFLIFYLFIFVAKNFWNFLVMAADISFFY